MKLEGRCVLVTGAARRVGRSIALELAQSGCDVAVHYHRSGEAARSLAEEIRSLGRRCHLVSGDVSDAGEWSRIIAETVDALGSLSILINNASVFKPTPLASLDAEVWKETFGVNVFAVAGLSGCAAPHLRAGGGKIINLSDISADRPWISHAAYCASKAALVSLTRSLAKWLAPAVQVNAVAPGIAIFPDHYDEATRSALVAKVPLGRSGTPGEVARAVRYLCADGDYVTGQVITVDGGRSIV